MTEPVMTPRIPDNLSAVVWAQNDGRVGIFMRPETSDKHATMAFAQAMQLLHNEKENQDLKENNALLLKQSIVAPGPEEHEFTCPEFPEEFDENGNRQIPDQEMYYMFDQAAEIIQRHPVFKKNYRSSTVARVLKEEAKKWTAEKPKKQ